MQSWGFYIPLGILTWPYLIMAIPLKKTDQMADGFSTDALGEMLSIICMCRSSKNTPKIAQWAEEPSTAVLGE